MSYKEQGNSGGFAIYRVLYYESMQVILHFISSCKEEEDFVKLVQDKIVIEIIVQSLLEHTTMNMREDLILLGLKALECILNFSMFENYQFSFNIDDHFEAQGGHHVVQNLMAFDHTEICVTATGLMQNYIEKEDELIPNMIE